LSSHQKCQEKRHRPGRTAQSSDDAWRWKARRCVWSPEEDLQASSPAIENKMC